MRAAKTRTMRSFVFLFLLSFSLSVQAQADSSNVFVCNNAAKLDTTDPANKLFDTDFYQHQYFFFGENHGSAIPLTVDLFLFKKLHQQAGVRFYIAEIDATKAWMVNRYLADGDTSWLLKVMASWKKDTLQWASRENYRKFQDLHAFYKKLPKDQKFQVVGIDVPQDYSLIHEQAVYLTGNAGKVLKPAIDSLLWITKDITNDRRSELNGYARRLLPQLLLNETALQKQLKERYPLLKHLVTSLGFIGIGMTRDSVFYRNFESLLNINGWQEKKMYGFLGYFHTLQTGYNKMQPFAALLARHKKTKGRIASFQMMAIDSKSMLPFIAPMRQMMPKAVAEKTLKQFPAFPQDGRYIPYDLSNDNSMMQIKGIETLKACSQPNSITLFRLTGKESPYSRSNSLAIVSGFQTLKPNDAAVVTTDIFQYVILFRNSGPATPL